MNIYRKTKIVATIGPASESPEVLSRLIDEGLDVARLNFSHGTHETHLARIQAIRKLEKEKGKHIAIVADMQGPKMRVGQLPKDGVLLKDEERVLLDTSIKTYDGGPIPVPSPIFAKGARKGSRVFLDDGSLLLEILAASGKQFTAKVLRGGTLYSHKGINVPELELRTNIFEKKDKDDMAFAIANGADYIAVSFIRNGHDMKEARRLTKGAPVKLIAKIERPEALENLDEIIELSDAIMVARGDLGIETPLWQLPMRQKQIIEKAHRRMRPVIVATQMLESMTKNAIPTRAEVSDVANAVYDSSDAVMLSAESASGRFPIEAVRMMRHIVEETERHAGPAFLHEQESFHSVDIAVAKSAKYVAGQVGARAILVGTATGFSARAVSRYRPNVPVVAVTSDISVARRLSVIWGVHAITTKGMKTIDDIEKAGVEHLKKIKAVSKGDHVVFVSGMRLGEAGQTNDITVIKVP